MIRVVLLSTFFLAMVVEELLGFGLVIVTGLSAKNAFLYVLLLTVLCTKVVERSNDGIQFPIIHLLFFLLIVDITLSIFYMHFVSGETAGYGLFSHIAMLKGHLLDMYLLFIVFFYGIDKRLTSVSMAKVFLAAIGMVGLVYLMDVMNVVNLGLIVGDQSDAAEGRLRGPLGGPNSYGVFFASFIPIFIIAAAGMGSSLMRVLFGICAAVCFALLIQTGSRGGFVSLFGGVLLAAWWLRGGYDFRKAALVFTGLFIVGVLLAIAVYATSEDVRSIVQHRIERSTAGNIDDISAGRVWIWGQGIAHLMARPWTLIVGAGWGTFWPVIGVAPHSNYIHYLFSVGIIGLGLFIGLIYTVLSILKEGFFLANGSSEERLLIGGLTISWFVLVIAMATGTNLKAWEFIWPISGLCLRIIYGLLTEQKQEKQNEVGAVRQSNVPSGSQPGGVYS